MWSLEHYFYGKSQQDRTIFGELGPKKTPKMTQFMDATLPQKHLEIYNLTVTNAMKMKLTTIVYLHETFHLTKDLGVTHRALDGVVEKSVKES